MAEWATAVQRQRYPRMSAVKNQRISDWRRGKTLPHRFESVEPLLNVLIKEALHRKTRPAIAGIYDLGQWRQWWSDARYASSGDATSGSPQIPSPTCPYQGLAAFEATDRARFFGRTRSVEELVAFIAKVRAADPGVVLLTGPSGAGKSSLLSAGLIPAASSGALDTGGGGWVAARITPCNDPAAELRRCLDHPDVARARAERTPLLIVVDQAEEMFVADVPSQTRAEFVGALHTMCQPSTSAPGVVVVMGIRSDALGHCVELPQLAGAVQSRCMVLEPMRIPELREVVTGPAKMARLSIEPGLVELILHDVAAENNAAQAARLPLLSHVLAGTWSQRQDGKKLTVAGYKWAGGLRGSVEMTGENAWKQLDEQQRAIARRMLLRLVTIGDAGYDSCRRESRRELLARFPDAENAASVLETLTTARLLTIDGGDITFTHEIVLRAWVRLATWIDDDRTSAPIRQRAEADAATWINNGRRRPFLLTGARLEATVALLDTIDVDDVDPSVAEFAEASLRRKRLLSRTARGAIVLVSVLAVLFGLAASVAFWQRSAMSRQRSAISRQYDTAVFNQVLAAADSRQLNDPSLSAQLSMVAHHLRPNDQTRSRLLATQNAPLATQLAGHHSVVSTVTFSPDGTLLASASWDNSVRLWDMSDPDDPKPAGQPLRGHSGVVTSVAFSPDGKMLASSGLDKTVRLWDLATPANVKELTAPLTGDGVFYRVAFSADGRTLAAPSDDGTIRLWVRHEVAHMSEFVDWRPVMAGT